MTEKRSGNAALSIALAAAALFLYARPTGPVSPVAPPNVPGEDLGTGAQFRAVFVGPTGAPDAAYLAAVFGAIADKLELDGSSATPLVTDRDQLRDLIRGAGTLATTGRTKGRYPGLLPILESTWMTHFPRESGPMAPPDRANAVRIYRALAQGLRSVGGA